MRRKDTGFLWPWGEVLIVLTGAGLLAGCGPDMNAVANRLRQENLAQRSQIQDLQEKLKDREATIQDWQARWAANNPPLRTLPPERLAQVFTATRVKFDSQTDAEDLGGGKWGFRVFLRTYGEDGQIVPASGTLTIEAVEIPPAPGEPRRIGVWTFTPEQMKASWYTELWANYFAFSCAWERPPAGKNILFKARLVDALTGRTLEAQLDKTISSLPDRDAG